MCWVCVWVIAPFRAKPRFCRSGRPRKMEPEKLRVVLEEEARSLSDDDGIWD